MYLISRGKDSCKNNKIIKQQADYCSTSLILHIEKNKNALSLENGSRGEAEIKKFRILKIVTFQIFQFSRSNNTYKKKHTLKGRLDYVALALKLMYQKVKILLLKK